MMKMKAVFLGLTLVLSCALADPVPLCLDGSRPDPATGACPDDVIIPAPGATGSQQADNSSVIPPVNVTSGQDPSSVDIVTTTVNTTVVQSPGTMAGQDPTNSSIVPPVNVTSAQVATSSQIVTSTMNTTTVQSSGTMAGQDPTNSSIVPPVNVTSAQVATSSQIVTSTVNSTTQTGNQEHDEVEVTVIPPVPDFCIELEEGDYAVSEGACSNEFVKCNDGATDGILFNCPATLVFDPVSDQCLFAMYVENCGGTPTEPPMTTTPSGDVTVPPFTFDCEGRFDGDYSDTENPCSRYYVSCSGGAATFRACPEELVFDILTGQCLDETYVKLCGGERTTLAPQDDNATLPAVDFDCTGLPDGVFPSADPACAQFFFTCVGEKAGQLDCPTDLFFDIISERCLEISFVEACGGEATEPPTDPTTTVADPGTIISCEGLEPGFFEDPNPDAATDSGVCSPIYFICSGAPVASVHECQEGLVFDIDELRCDFPAETPGCGGVNDPTITTTPPPQADPAPVGFCAVAGEGDHALEEGECGTQFVSCPAAGEGVLLTCQAELYYDAELNECAFFDTIPECTGEPRTTPAPTTTIVVTTDPALSGFCAGREDGNFPFTEDCPTAFVTCTDGSRADLFRCPGETRYSVEEDACLDPLEVAGCEDVATGERPCVGRENGFYAIEGQCTQYLFCADGIDTVLNCESGLVFNPDQSRCIDSTGPLDGSCGLPHENLPFDCEGLEPGFHVRENDCKNYFFCEADGSAWPFTCEPGFAFDVTRSRCVPEVMLDQCVPPMNDELINFCLRRQDGVFENPLDCTEGVVCYKAVALMVVCPEDSPMFDIVDRECVAQLSASSTCVPADSVQFVDAPAGVEFVPL